MIGLDTLHAAETLTDAGIDATHAKAVVAAPSEAVGEPIMASEPQIAEQHAKPTWRIVPAPGAFAAPVRLMP